MVSEQGIKIYNLVSFDHIAYISLHLVNAKNILSEHDMSKFGGV